MKVRNRKACGRRLWKKFAASALLAGFLLSLSACGGGQGNTSGTSQASAAGEGNGSTQDSSQGESLLEGNILIAYFSVPETDGTDTVAGASRVVVDGEVLGNNQYVAQLIQQETGGDLFRIETVQEYPGSHDALLDFAYSEMVDNARPELATQIENPDSYDVIFLGYPKMEPGFACV